MGKHYCQLNEQKRISLGILLRNGYSKAQVADILGVHRATVYREIKRNSSRYRLKKGYLKFYGAQLAQRKSIARRQRRLKLLKEKELREYVHNKLLKGWSPWQIEGRLKLENGKCIISHETIYRYIYSDNELRNQLYKKLRRKHFFRVKRGQRKPRIPKELMIENRPKEINSRDIFGHWECDLMIFKKGVKGNLITLRERVSRYLLAIKNANKTAQGTALTLISTVKGYKSYINSITFDQGSEFQRYDWIRGCLETEIYFCEPGAPEQKGAVENVNGVIRVEFPRSLDIDDVKQDEISKVAAEINERPLKCLGYKTPKEVFTEYTGCILR